MLLSPSDLLNKINGQLSTLQLAYLVKVEAISGPIVIQNDPNGYLFDSDHILEVVSLRLGENPSVSEDVSEKSQEQNSKYTSDVLRLLKKEIIKKPSGLSNLKIDDLFKKQRTSTSTRIINYLFKFRLYNTTLTGDEHLELSAMHAIGAMNLMFHLVQAVAPRLLKFDTSSSFDMSLKSLIDSHIDLGWGLFANELEAIDKIFLAVPSMRDLSVPDGLTRISELEITYKALEQKCLDYVRKIDPDRLIMLRLYNDHYASKILEKINIAEKRSFNKFKNLLPGTDVIKKPLEDLLKNR